MNSFPRSAVFPLPTGAGAGGVSNKKLEEELAQYFLLAGRAVAQIATFGTTAGALGRLLSTSNATKGTILFGEGNNGLRYNEVNNRFGSGTATLLARLHIGAGAQGAAGTTVGGNAETGMIFQGPNGGIANAESKNATAKGGAGGGISAVAGEAGKGEAATETSTGGFGGAVFYEGGAGGKGVGSLVAKKTLGGEGGPVEHKGGFGGAAEGATETNTGGLGGKCVMKGGEGGPAEAEGAGHANAGTGGEVNLEGGLGGGAAGGIAANGPGGRAYLAGGNALPGAQAGNAVIRGGKNTAGEEVHMGNIELKTGNAETTGFILTGEGKIALYRGTVPVAQHAAIANPIEELKSVRAKLEEVIAALKAIGITA